MKLADVKAALPGTVLKDDVVPGLQLIVKPRAKGWFVYYRAQTGEQRRPKIGEWPTISLEQARTLARQTLGKVAAGDDPSRQRAIARAGETIEQLGKRYLEDYVETNKKATSATDDRRYVEKVFGPRWGTMRPADLTAEDLFKLRRAYKTKPIAFNRCMACLSKMLNFGGYPNVSKQVPRYPERKRQRFIEGDEFLSLAAALEEVGRTSPHAVAAIKLLLLTGARMGEIVRCKRDWRKGAQLRIPDHKTDGTMGLKVIHLPQEAVDILDSLPVTGDWLCGISSRPTKAWNRIVKLTGLPHFTIHDLRRTYVSEGLDAGFSLDQLGKMVGHKSTATTSRYAFLVEMKKKSGATTIGASIGAKI